MSEEIIIVKSAARTAMSWIIRGVLCCLMILIFLLMTQSVVIIEAPVHFVLGWLFHAIKTIPPLLGNWRSFLLAMGCLVLAGVLIHRFIRRWLDSKGDSRRWHPMNTLAGISLLLLGCGAAIALSGIVHQSVWLMSDQWTEDRSKRAELTQAVSNARQLMMALAEFYNEKGHYPNSLQELETDFGAPPQLKWAEIGHGKVWEPFVLLRPGATRVARGDEPLIVSPVIQREGKIAVGYGDGSVRSLPANKLGNILAGEEMKPSTE